MFTKLYYKFLHLLQESERSQWSNLALSIYGSRSPALTLYNPGMMLEELVKKGRASARDFPLRHFVRVGAVVGYIRLMIPEQPCAGAMEVVRSAINDQYQGKGMGRILYRLAMEVVNAPITPDRNSVSAKAERVWQSLEKDSSVEKLPPQQPPYKGTFDNARKPTTPPNDDDCIINPGYDEHGNHNPEERSLSFLNKAYDDKNSGEIASLLKMLTANNKKFFEAVNDNAEKIKFHSIVSNGWLDQIGLILFIQVA